MGPALRRCSKAARPAEGGAAGCRRARPGPGGASQRARKRPAVRIWPQSLRERRQPFSPARGAVPGRSDPFSAQNPGARPVCHNHARERPASSTRSPMANLPKIRRGQGRGRGPADEPRADRASPDVQRLEAHGLTWLNIESPTQLETAWLAEHYDFHPLDLEDVLSRRRQRAKIDEYPDYVFIVLHFPRFDKRAGRLQAAELNLFVMEDLVITLPNEPLKPLNARLVALRAQRDGARAADEQGLGLPALRDRRRDVRLLLPDPRQDRLQAGRDRGRAVRGRERRPGPRHLEHQAGDHQLPPHREAAADHAAPARPQQPALRAPGPRASTSTTSSTRASASGTSSRTTRRSPRRSTRRTSR